MSCWRLTHGRAEWPLSLVTDLYVFGSFARGAIEPRDVDIDVEFKIDQRWAEHFAGCLAYGRDPHSPFRRALTAADADASSSSASRARRTGI
jgi:hypothetical protein